MTAPLRLYVRRSETPEPDSDTSRVQISLRVPTDLDVVEETVDLVARHCLACGVPPRVARFVVRVVLCETLANAIVHGNRMDPSKRVEVRVEVGSAEVSLHVRDEGSGFNPGMIPDPTEPERIDLAQGRGLFLIHQLMDEVHFNERGNAICMIMRRE